MFLGDYAIGETVVFYFTTTEPDTGAPATLSGTPALSAYVGASDTQLTAGITLAADADSVTGLNRVTAVLTTGNGYADNTDVTFVITTGTVDGNSAVGYVVGRVTLGRAGAYKRLGAPAGASIAADIAVIEGQTDDIGVAGAGLTVLATAAALQTVDDEIATIDSNVDAILVDTAEIGTAGAGLTALATQVSVNTIDDFLDTEIAAILADTAELQGDWVDGGRLDLILDARASQTSVDDVPTVAEFNARTLVSAGYASPTNITAGTITTVTNLTNAPTSGDLTATMKASVNAEADTAVAGLLSGIITGAAATGTLSTTVATTDLTGYADDQLIGRVLIVLSGDAEGEVTDITDYAEIGGMLTFTALTTAMADSDTFKIV
jgi:hypothetical protein